MSSGPLVDPRGQSSPLWLAVQKQLAPEVSVETQQVRGRGLWELFAIFWGPFFLLLKKLGLYKEGTMPEGPEAGLELRSLSSGL